METNKVLALAGKAGMELDLNDNDDAEIITSMQIKLFAALIQQQMEAENAERQWVGLTDDEVYNALPGYPIDYKLEFYRAIEAKLKEKNG